MEGVLEQDALEAEAEATQLQEILDSTLKAANDPEQIRREAAARKAEYKRRHAEAMKRFKELRIELQNLEAEKVQQEASRRDNVVDEEAPPRQERRAENHSAARRPSVYDTKLPLSYGLQAEAWPCGFKMPQIAPYDGKTDYKAFIMSFEAAIQSVGGGGVIPLWRKAW